MSGLPRIRADQRETHCRRDSRWPRWGIGCAVGNCWVVARAAALLATAAVAVGGCGRADDAQGPRLLVYCGAGIRPAAAEILDEFQRLHGVTIECDYDGSERLLARIKLSKTGDLYMPGDVAYVEQAREQGLVGASKDVCYFVPVILVQKGNPKSIRSLEDLTRPGIAVGLGNPEACAVGRKSLMLFQKNGISSNQIEPNVKFLALTVNDLGNHIKLKKLDAVIVWDAMAAYFADDADAVAIPAAQNIISTVAAGVLNSSRQPELAGQLLEFLASEHAARIFRKHHYTTTPPY